MKEFEMKDLGELKSFLSIQVTRNHSKCTMMLSQGYVDTILECFGFTEANPSWMLMVMQKLEGLTKKSLLQGVQSTGRRLQVHHRLFNVPDNCNQA